MNRKGKKFFSIVLAWLVIAASVFGGLPQASVEAASVSLIASEAQLQDDLQDGVTLHCWNWSYNNIAAKMEQIASLGYSSIQTSPVQQAKEGTTGKTVGSNWWVYYQPASFSIDNTGSSALGTKAEFVNMCNVAHQYGVKVIVDVVANHMGNKTSNNLADTIIDDLKYDSSCWHNISINTTDYNNRYNITQYCMDGLPDLNTGSSKVQTYALNFLKECIDAGVDGFRFDGAKHIETPQDSASGCGSDFWPNVINGATSYAASTRGIDLYCYGEVLDQPGGSLSISAYTQYFSVTDNQTGNVIRNNVNSGNASGAASSYYYKGTTANNIVLWSESHDTYSNNESNYVSAQNINKTWAIVAARANAMSLYFARPNSTSSYLGAADVTGWSWDEVGAVNRFHNAFVGQTEYLSSSGSIAYCERGTSGVVLVNCSGTSQYVEVTANKMADGTYTDQVSGSTFTVSGGKIKGTIGSKGFAVVYNPSANPDPDPDPDPDPNPSTNVAYLDKPSSWGSNLYCYVYSADNESVKNATWPGVAMTNVSGSIYKYTVSSSITNPRVIFTDGTNQYPAAMQTGLTLSGSMIYQNGTWTAYTPPVTTSNVAYIRLPSSWSSTLYCYAYSKTNESNRNAVWPGVQMTCVTGNLYKYEVPSTITTPLVIFTDGVNQYPGAMQSGLELSGSMIYDNGSWSSYSE